MQFLGGPEKQIRKRMDRLQSLVSSSSDQGNLAMIADLHQLGAFFVVDAEVLIEVQAEGKVRLVGREEIVRAAGAVRQQLVDVDVEFLDVTVTVASDKQSAEVEATCRARQSGASEVFIEELRFHFIREDNEWIISRVETVRTLTGVIPTSPQLRHLPSAA